MRCAFTIYFRSSVNRLLSKQRKLQQKSLPGYYERESNLVPPVSAFSRRIASMKNLIHPRAIKPLRPKNFELPILRNPSAYSQGETSRGANHLKRSSQYTSSEDEYAPLMSSSLPKDALLCSTNNSQLINQRRRQFSPGHRRSHSNQTISIRNDGHGNEIVLKSSMSDQNFIFQNENFSDDTGQYNQNMFISRRHDPEGSSSNILVASETFGTGQNRVKSMRIKTDNSADEKNSVICLKNASNSGTARILPSVTQRYSVALPSVPMHLTECVARETRHAPRVESSASLDGFQVRAPFGVGQRKHVNEMSAIRPFPSAHAVGGDKLLRKYVATIEGAKMLPRCDNVMTRSFDPIGAEQDLVEYDSDTGWKRRSMPMHIFSSWTFEEPQSALPISKVSVAEVKDTGSRNLIESMPRTSSTMKHGEEAERGTELASNDTRRPEAGKRRRPRRKSQSVDDVSGKESAPRTDLNFKEYGGRNSAVARAKLSRNAPQLPETKMDDKECSGAFVSVRNTSQEVTNKYDDMKRNIEGASLELATKPKINSYMSDESTPRQLSHRQPRDVMKKNTIFKNNETTTRDQLPLNSEEKYKMPAGMEEEGSDDVFIASSFARSRPASFSSKNKKTNHPKRRTSSLEDLVKFKERLVESRGKSVDGLSRKTSSSVSINETPQVHTYDKDNDSSSFRTLRSMARRTPTNSTSSLNDGVAPLNATPVRGSLKKSTASPSKKPPGKTKSPKKCKKSNNSSEYDPRERRRDGNGNERDMYRYRERGGDRDKELSDREQKDSQNDSFNRSLSNAEGTPDDKIGEMVVLNFRTCPHIFRILCRRKFERHCCGSSRTGRVYASKWQGPVAEK